MKIVNIGELVGKTISDAYKGDISDNSPVCLVFTDGTKVIIESSEDEIVQVHSEYQVSKPQLVAKPDFSRLISMSQNYLEALEAGTNADDYDHYIYEEALAAIFGASVFDYINERID